MTISCQNVKIRCPDVLVTLRAWSTFAEVNMNILAQKVCRKCEELKFLDDFQKDKSSKDGHKGSCRQCCNQHKTRKRREKGIPSRQWVDLELLPRLANDLGLSIDCDKYYLSFLCKGEHDWNGTGYTLRERKNRECPLCHGKRRSTPTTEQKQQQKDKQRYLYWLKNPRVSPSVAWLVEKAEQEYRRNYRYKFDDDIRDRQNAAYRARYQKNIERERTRVKVYKHANPDKVAKWGDKRRQKVLSQSDGTASSRCIKALLNNADQCPYCGVNLTPDTATIDHIIPISKGGLHSAFNLIACCLPCNVKKSNKSFAEWINELDEKFREKSESLYRKRYGTQPEQCVIPLVFR